MNAPNFSFPPPPPPPPKAAPSTYQAHGQASYLQSNGLGGRGGRPPRGRGRGEGYRGSRGGMFRGHGSSSHFSAGPPRVSSYRPTSNSGYSHHTHTNASTSYPLPEYPREQQSHYQAQQNGFSQYPQPGNYSQSVFHGVAQPYTNQPHNPSLLPQSDTNGYGSLPYGPAQLPFQAPSNWPSMMGPAIRMGFESNLARGCHSQSNQAKSHGRSEHTRGMGANPRYYDHSSTHGERNPNYPKRNSTPSSYHIKNNRMQNPKRGASTASQRSGSSPARAQAAPAVPSFGISLPLKPPPPSDNGKISRKKKRKHNQLGLTPKADVHESSEEEEDGDEEAKLAAAAAAGGSEQKHLQFTYRGQTATLQTSADIAAWIEERKKRFPTRARVQEAAERKRVHQEAQKAAKEAFRQTQEKRQSELRERRRQEKAEEDKKEREKARSYPEDIASKAKLKAEKLRKRLEKEEKKIARAEARAEETKLKTEATQDGASFPRSVVAGSKRKRGATDGIAESLNHISETPDVSGKHELPNGKRDEEPDAEANAYTKQSPTPVNGNDVSLEEMITAASANACESQLPGSQPLVVEPDSTAGPGEAPRITHNTINGEPPPLGDIAETVSESDDTTSISSSSPEPSSDDDDTSPSGSSSDEGAPEEAPSKRDGPERVLPPKREKPKSRCTQFLKTGYCKRGNRCKFLHELPERGSSQARLANVKKGVVKSKEGFRPKRKSLYERLVEQEKDKEDEQVLRAIIRLGQSGVLDPPATASDPATTPAENGS